MIILISRKNKNRGIAYCMDTLITSQVNLVTQVHYCDVFVCLESSAAPTPRPRTPEIPLQPSFMPSSTPEHLNPRYLCWNDVAIIRSYGCLADEDSGKSIEIEFHNSTFHNSMMLQNYQDYTMGCVSTAVVAVANAKYVYNLLKLSKHVSILDN